MFLALYIFITAQLAWAVPNFNPVTSLGGHLPLNRPNRARHKPRDSSKPRQALSWYASWHSDDFTLQNDVSWDRYNTLIYAFV